MTTNTPAALAARRVHLNEAQRRLLLDLIETHGDETIEAIARRFADQTSRKVSEETVRRAWTVGYRAGCHLTEREREVLADLCCATPTGYGSVPAIARRFRDLTGRMVHIRTIRLYRAQTRDAKGVTR